MHLGIRLVERRTVAGRTGRDDGDDGTVCAGLRTRDVFLDTLAIAALGVALVRPESIATASFALSFSCVGAIFACAGPLERWFDSQLRSRAAFARRWFCRSPRSWARGRWAPPSFFSLRRMRTRQPRVVPCVGATMALGAVQLALAWVPPLAQAAANLDSWLLVWMVAVVRTLATLPGAAIAMTPAPAWCILFYDAALASAPYLVRRGAVGIAAGALALSALLGFVAPPRAFEGRMRVTMLDVGQADAIVVQTPRGHDLLIDAGGRLERGPQGADSIAELVGERIVVPFLLRNGIHALDTLFVSHPHGDHAGGAAPVIATCASTSSPTADSLWRSRLSRRPRRSAGRRSRRVSAAGLRWRFR